MTIYDLVYYLLIKYIKKSINDHRFVIMQMNSSRIEEIDTQGIHKVYENWPQIAKKHLMKN